MNLALNFNWFTAKHVMPVSCTYTRAKANTSHIINFLAE